MFSHLAAGFIQKCTVSSRLVRIKVHLLSYNNGLCYVSTGLNEAEMKAPFYTEKKRMKTFQKVMNTI